MSRGKQKRPLSRAVLDTLQRMHDSEKERRILAAKEKKRLFLDNFLDFTSIHKTCEAIGVEDNTIYRYCIEDPDFRVAVDNLRKVRDIKREENEEEFLHLMGTGKIKVGKETGLGMPNVVAAKMGLVARNSKRWSERISVDRTDKRTIKVITVHAGGQDDNMAIDSPEVKELPVGDSD